MSVQITLQESFEDAERQSVPPCSLNERLEGFEDILEGIRVIYFSVIAKELSVYIEGILLQEFRKQR